MIGYYVHHHGRGHVERAAAVARAMTGPVVAITSLPRPDDIAPFADWVQLARDDVDDAAWAHTAGGMLHWAPLDSGGYRARMHRLASWLANAAPDLVVVDVSVEVSVLCRSLGVPVMVMAGAGQRADAPHQLAYGLASRIVVPWPAEIHRPAHLAAFADRTDYVGAFSRFDGREVVRPQGTGRVLVLWGRGGSEVGAAEVAAAREACEGWDWSAPGLDGTPWCADVWAALSEADIVVTHAGMNALAEVAAARRPAVVVPQPRPFDEQVATAEALGRHGLCAVADRWPAADSWPALLAEACRIGGQGWRRWNRGDGAQLAAASIAAVVAERRARG